MKTQKKEKERILGENELKEKDYMFGFTVTKISNVHSPGNP